MLFGQVLCSFLSMHRTASTAKSGANTGKPLSQDPRKIRVRRTAAGLSLTQMALQAECSKGHLSEVERGNYSASAPLLARLARVLGCQILDLMPDDDAETAA